MTLPSTISVRKVSPVATMQTAILNRQKNIIEKQVPINCAGLLTDGSPARSKAAAIFASAAAAAADLVNLEFK